MWHVTVYPCSSVLHLHNEQCSGFSVALKYWHKSQHCDFYSEAFSFCFPTQRGCFLEGRSFWIWVQSSQLGGRNGKLPPSKVQAGLHQGREQGFLKTRILFCSSQAFLWPLYVRVSVQAQSDPQNLGTQPAFSFVMLSACGPWHQVLARSLPQIFEGPRARVQLEALSTQPWIHFALKGIFAPTFHPYPAKRLPSATTQTNREILWGYSPSLDGWVQGRPWKSASDHMGREFSDSG